MNFKIIETSNNWPDVLIYRDRSDSGAEQVKITTFGTTDGNDTDMHCEETIEFKTSLSAIQFVKDYSKDSADAWCKSEGITF